MIRFGPAGIPLSCKGRTLQNGIEDVHNLSLSAMEIQMVRSSAYARPPDDEEIGMTLKDIEEGFVLEIVRDGELIVDPDEPIEEDDDLIYMPSGVSDTYGDLFWTNEMAKRLDVNLSIHTPFYMDLGSNNDLTENCMDSIRHAALILNALGGDVVVTSLGVYDDKTDREEIDENILNNVADIMDWWQGNGLTPRLGVEVTGQEDVFGSLDQILDLCDQIPGVIPVLNFSHLHSRTNGSLLDVDDFLNVLEQVESYSDGRIHTAFAGVEYSEGNEKRLTPIKKGDLRFEPLAEALIEMKPNATVISTSPLLEHDAMYMKIILERVLAKKVAKDMKERKKAEMAAASE
ncbi:MAG: TIM barrel protein [Candidatus Methanomethylophilaceae archaeon]|jgi:deoxyribonuclease-4|nr:TIM barrel protein [Candidatus Methanomethylophilaceae archaeon]MBR6213738.1 TIM barrel protein [Candidatus Methanomethylophilaceae archaeon]